MISLPQEAPPGLHDIVAPEPVSWAPETVGWMVLLVAALALTAWVLARRHRKRVANRYRFAALDELASIERTIGVEDDAVEALAELPALVKRVALSFADRDRVASLTGDAWLAFLDEAYGGSEFTRGPGRFLPELAYARTRAAKTLNSTGATEIITLVRSWIETHDARKVNREPAGA